MIQACDLTLRRDADNGLLKGSSLGKVRTELVHNTFGELLVETASYHDIIFYQAQYSYDKLGRITQKTEIIEGQTTQSQYEYELTGRLVSVTVDGVVTKYRYDGNGNRTHVNDIQVASYDNQDRLLQIEIINCNNVIFYHVQYNYQEKP
jgi:YD repeat-containing protein